MPIKIYEYKSCSTCIKAKKWLDKNNISYTTLPIVDQPPTLEELQTMLKHIREQGGDLKNIFNSSGEQYRALKMSEKLKAGMSEAEALKLLSQNGKLIKRPFVLTKNKGTVGFKEDIWSELF